MEKLDYWHDFMRHWLRMSHEMYLAMRTLQQDHGLTGKQFGLLRIISWIEPASLTDLKAFAPGCDSGLSQIVDRLVRKGVVRREQDPEDRRKITLSLDETGRKILESMPVIGPSRVMQNLDTMDEAAARRLVQSMADVANALLGEENPAAPHAQLYEFVDWKVEEEL